MPCRRPHRKSRLGCKTCKTKRLKCDEVHPICGLCRKNGMKCDFDVSSKSKLPPSAHAKMLLPMKSHSLSLHPAKLPNTSADILNSQTKPTNLPSITINTPSDRLLELKLLHHYLTTVSTTLYHLFSNRCFQEALKRDLFSQWVTSLSLADPGLMSALLSFSAFNLRKLQPHPDPALNHASHTYLTSAIAAHSQQLEQGINENNAEILFAGSALIAFIAISSHEYISPENDASLPLHWFQPWQGVRSIVRDTWRGGHIRSEEILALLESERKSTLLGLASPDARLGRFDFLLEGLDRDGVDEEVWEAYETSVNWLTVLEENPFRDYCFTFTAQVPAKFVQLLKEDDPRTLTIVGYFFMVLHESESLWWLPRTTGKEFRILMEKLPEEWRPRMAMAVKVFEGCDKRKNDAIEGQ